VARGSVGIGIDRYRLGTEFVDGPDDPDGDFAAIGHKDSSEHGLSPN
jgi:hypothetical protein